MKIVQMDRLDFSDHFSYIICLIWSYRIKERKKGNLDEVFFLKGETNARAQKKNTRELHLELVGDKVTYVRVY